jgi:hypothetical protein
MQYDKSNRIELNCAAFKSRLDAVLDARCSPQLDLQLCAHTRRCPSCARWLATQMGLLDAMQDTAAAEPSADFALQVLQTMDVHRQQQQRRRMRAMACVALAASLLIAVIAWRGPAPSEGPANLPFASQSPKIPAEVLKRMDEVSQDIKPVSGSVYTALNAFWLAQRLL